MKLAIVAICLLVSVMAACAQGVSNARDASENLIRDAPALRDVRGPVYPPGANVLPHKSNFSSVSHGSKRSGNVGGQTKD
jgi:hypothetical protein